MKRLQWERDEVLAGEIIVMVPKELRREVKSTICSENNKNQPPALDVFISTEHELFPCM